MKLVFNGFVEAHSTGCGTCGHRKSEHHFVSSKSYILPSGTYKTFRVGKVEEVSERDGRFLLTYMFDDENGRRAAFTEVKDGD